MTAVGRRAERRGGRLGIGLDADRAELGRQRAALLQRLGDRDRGARGEAGQRASAAPSARRRSPAAACPARRRPGRSPRTQHASGSTSVAAASLTPSGISSMSRAAFSAGTRMRSAKPPGWMRVRLNVSHSVSCPRRHSSHSPHGTWWCTKTRSPGEGSSASTGRPGADHDADRLVPEHQRRARLDVPLHQVRAADAARAHRDEHLARPGLRHVALLHAGPRRRAGRPPPSRRRWPRRARRRSWPRRAGGARRRRR